jgi:phage terminase small subunit
MARPRKPTAELELNGSFTKDPQRRESRKYEPPPNGPIGDPPNYFDCNQRDFWHEVVDLVPVGVLTKADRIIVEVIVRKLQDLRNGEITGTGLNTLVAALSRLGLTPADRSRVGIQPEKDENGEEDDFGTFLKQNKPN